MTTYRPKIKAVEAIQFDQADVVAARMFVDSASLFASADGRWVLEMPGNTSDLDHGDWIVRYPSGELRIYMASEFLQFFEPVPVEGGAAS
jgi:hypothetical protein